MSKEGWGFSKQNANIKTDQKVQKKTKAFWEMANQNVILVPDIDVETQARNADVSNPTGIQMQKLVDFYDLQIETRKNTLPATQQGVDLSALLSSIRTSQQLQQPDQPWQFSKLKTEVYQLVSQLNKSL